MLHCHCFLFPVEEHVLVGPLPSISDDESSVVTPGQEEISRAAGGVGPSLNVDVVARVNPIDYWS